MLMVSAWYLYYILLQQLGLDVSVLRYLYNDVATQSAVSLVEL